HLLHHYRGLDCLCPWTRLFIRDQRHGRNLPRPMTGLTIVLKNGKYIFGKRNLRGRIGCLSGHGHRQSKNDVHHNLGLLKWFTREFFFRLSDLLDYTANHRYLGSILNVLSRSIPRSSSAVKPTFCKAAAMLALLPKG